MSKLSQVYQQKREFTSLNLLTVNSSKRISWVVVFEVIFTEISLTKNRGKVQPFASSACPDIGKVWWYQLVAYIRTDV